jgi:hypothetical protein
MISRGTSKHASVDCGAKKAGHRLGRHWSAVNTWVVLGSFSIPLNYAGARGAGSTPLPLPPPMEDFDPAVWKPFCRRPAGRLNQRPFLAEEQKTSARAECSQFDHERTSAASNHIVSKDISSRGRRAEPVLARFSSARGSAERARFAPRALAADPPVQSADHKK